MSAPTLARDADGQPALDTAQAEALAIHLIGADDLQGSCLSDLLREGNAGGDWEALAAWVLAAADVMRAAEAQEGHSRDEEYREYSRCVRLTEAAVRAMRAAWEVTREQ